VAWDLVRHRVVTDYALKVGDAPGVVQSIEVGSPEEASEIVSALPAAQLGMLTFELDPAPRLEAVSGHIPTRAASFDQLPRPPWEQGAEPRMINQPGR